MLEYDPCKPHVYDKKIAAHRRTEVMKITEAVLNLTTPEDAYRRRLDITRTLDPQSIALREAELEDAKDRAASRMVKGNDKMNIGAKLLAKMGFSGSGGVGKSEGIATPLMHQKDMTGALPGNVAAVVAADESEQLRRQFRMINGRPSPVLLIRGAVESKDIEVDDTAFRRDMFMEFSKFGSVRTVQIYVTAEDEVRVFVVYDKATSAIKAMDAMVAKTYQGRQLTINFYDENDYDDQVYDN
eukprot:PhF_6_TR43642/c0_g1_i1/m.67061/K12840/RBM17, SPF45; splicing factor 45